MSDLEPKIKALLKLASDPVGVVVAPGELSDPQAFANETRMAVHLSSAIGHGHYYIVHRDSGPRLAVHQVIEPLPHPRTTKRPDQMI